VWSKVNFNIIVVSHHPAQIIKVHLYLLINEIKIIGSLLKFFNDFYQAHSQMRLVMMPQ